MSNDEYQQAQYWLDLHKEELKALNEQLYWDNLMYGISGYDPKTMERVHPLEIIEKLNNGKQ